jgi:hypothetical protein
MSAIPVLLDKREKHSEVFYLLKNISEGKKEID